MNGQARSALVWASRFAPLILIAAAGCNPSVVEMRERDPVQAWLSTLPPAAVLQCVQARLDSEGGQGFFASPLANLRTHVEEREGTHTMLARGAMNNAPEFIISARPTPGAGTHVELRTWLGWPKVIGPIVGRCAQGQPG
jgi:hypothetical protein